MILIAGPYRSGTDDDPARMAENLARLEEAAWPIFAAGHVPMIGEWVALPVLRSAGQPDVTGPLGEQVMYPTAQRLLEHCDAVLRLPGQSNGRRPGRGDRARARPARVLRRRRDPVACLVRHRHVVGSVAVAHHDAALGQAGQRAFDERERRQ